MADDDLEAIRAARKQQLQQQQSQGGGEGGGQEEQQYARIQSNLSCILRSANPPRTENAKKKSNNPFSRKSSSRTRQTV